MSLAVLADSSETFRPAMYEIKRWGFRLLFEFLSIKLLDFQDRIEDLKKSTNPFAVVTHVHLRMIEAGNDSDRRLFCKISLVKKLYHKGFNKQDILNLYRFIDWIITLPEELEIVFHEEIINYDRSFGESTKKCSPGLM